MPEPSTTPQQRAAHAAPQETIKDTLISIVIAFTVAFVFRGFVIEAFVIPTGSMAPTLMGQHMKFHGERTGTTFAVGPWDAVRGNTAEYLNPQDGRTFTPPGRQPGGIQVYDPASGDPISTPRAALYSGDRILVLKYLYALLEPRRYDVVVFKNPTDPLQNYIKRLIGLPGEEIALVDGDVFVRPAADAATGEPAKLSWEQGGWTIARKPALQQRAVWQTVFDSGDAPLNFDASRTPWTPAPGADGAPAPFTLDSRRYTFNGGSGTLLFDQAKPRIANPSAPLGARNEPWLIDDYYAYNETPAYDARPPRGIPRQSPKRFPVSDLRVRLAVEPTSSADAGVGVSLVVRAHDFAMSTGGGKAEIRWRPLIGASGVKGDWATLASVSVPALPEGRATNLEFWHADQSLSIWVDGERVVHADYNWSPSERILFATGTPIAELMARQPGNPANVLEERPQMYTRPEVRLTLSGPSMHLYRVGLDRDLHYQPGSFAGQVGHATSPLNPLVLGADEFFCCGDNSPASLDGRLWSDVDPWVDYEFRPGPNQPIRAGVVPRDLMLGRAFFVYWPSLRYSAKPMPVPDFGRMRFIW